MAEKAFSPLDKEASCTGDLDIKTVLIQTRDAWHKEIKSPHTS